MLTFIELDSLSFSEIKYAILRQSGVMTGVEVLSSGGGLAQSPQTILNGASIGLSGLIIRRSMTKISSNPITGAPMMTSSSSGCQHHE